MELTFFTSLILGIVEGLTEFAPVSSTAHILIAGNLANISTSAFFTLFTIAIQSGAIVAAIIYFWKTLWNNLSLIPKVVVGFIPTAIIGLFFHTVLTALFSSTTLIGWMLILGGIIFLFLKPIDTPSEITSISYKQAFIIGCTQILAFIPGVSRSGATLIGGTALKIPRAHIVAFSFLLGIPTILGASVVELGSMPSITHSQILLLVTGTITAFVVSLLTMKWFITVLTKKPLSWFGWYRIAIGLIVIFFIA